MCTRLIKKLQSSSYCIKTQMYSSHTSANSSVGSLVHHHSGLSSSAVTYLNVSSISVYLFFLIALFPLFFLVTAPEALNINAEAGLCVVIPCHNSSDQWQSAVWYKCEQKCDHSVIIIDLNNTNPNAQSGFRGRVSLLEPDVSQRNCSIIINDLTESDSGSYHLNETQSQHTVYTATITVKGICRPLLVTSTNSNNTE